MNRRSFLMGGGVVSVAAAAVSLVIRESKPEHLVQSCADYHEPDPTYIRGPAITISNSESETQRALVPCLRCGTLLALTHNASSHRVGIHATGWAKSTSEKANAKDQAFMDSAQRFREI